MDTLAQTLSFQFPPTQQLHDTRTRRIHTLLQPGTVPNRSATAYGAASYCHAHHALEGAEAAARGDDTATFNWYRAHPDANAPALGTPTTVGARVIVTPDLDRLPRSGISETPYYLLGPATCHAPAELRNLTAQAFAIGADTGFSELLTGHAVIVCLLRRKQLGDTLDSWTITRLPGTIFCDYTSHPTVLARDLIHEAGHNWLNDALRAIEYTISDKIGFFSPWKGTFRPAFGFIHACWAFPLTMLFTARALESTTSGKLQQYLTAYLDKQRPLLAATASDHDEAIGLIEDPGLQEHLQTVYQQARTL
jgi:hypothetical protein